MQTSATASNPTQTPGGGPRTDRAAGVVRDASERANQSAFDAVFAQLAQFASADASRNGKLSLGVGQRLTAEDALPGSRGLRSKGVPQDATSTRPGAEVPGGRNDSRLSDSIARGRQRLSQGKPGPLATKARAPGGEQSTGSERGNLPGNPRQTGETSRDVRAGVGGGQEAEDTSSPTRDGASAAANTQQAAVGGTAGIAGQSRGGPSGAPGQSAATITVGRAGVSAPGGGATTATHADAVALGGKSSGPSLSATPPKTAARQPAGGTAKTMSAFRAQVAQGLSAALRRGRGDVTLRLTPKALGELRIELRVRDGAVDARLHPATHEARGLLERSVDTLRHALEARGLRVGRIEIEHAPEGRDGSLEQHQDQDPGGQDGRAGDNGAQGRHHSAEPGGSQRRSGDGVRHTAEEAPTEEVDGKTTSRRAGGPGIVYGVADGAARIVMVDALV